MLAYSLCFEADAVSLDTREEGMRVICDYALLPRTELETQGCVMKRPKVLLIRTRIAQLAGAVIGLRSHSMGTTHVV